MCTIFKRLYLISLKFIPLIQTLILILSIIFEVNGVLRYYIDLLFGCSIISGLRLLTASKVLNFCTLHRLVITYNCYTFVVIKLRQIYGVMELFVILKPFHITIGILLLTYAIIDKVLLKNNKYYIKFKNKLKWHNK